MGKSVREKYPLLFKDNSDKIEKRFNKAWEEARKAAGILKKEFGAERG